MAVHAKVINVPATGAAVLISGSEAPHSGDPSKKVLITSVGAVVLGGKDLTVANAATNGYALAATTSLPVLPLGDGDAVYAIAPAGATTVKVVQVGVA